MSPPPTPPPPVTIEGYLFDGSASASELTTAVFDPVSKRIRVRLAEQDVIAESGQYKVQPPLGRLRRKIELPGGRVFESDDREAMDRIGKLQSRGSGLRLVHLFESKMRYVLLALVILFAFVWAVYQFGIPAMAKHVAAKLPYSMSKVASEQTEGIINELMFDPSALDSARQAEITEGFQRVADEMGSEPYEYQLKFRNGRGMQNAFALPSGTIYVTDELVNDAQDDREIFAVMAHEVSHVEMQHGMRSVLQNTGVFVLISLALGDVASVTSLGAALPTALAKSGYSRKFENEADEEAAHYCIERGWTTSPLRDILTRIAPPGDGSDVTNWISSHPDTAKRVEHLLEIERERK
ncbi:MAG: M48 family metallopeptidase [Verrucomicrobiota bacterium]